MGERSGRFRRNKSNRQSQLGRGICREKRYELTLNLEQILSLDPTPTSLLHLTPPNPSSPLTSLAWAPSCGRSYHLLATGSRDGSVRIWRLEPPGAGDEYDMDEKRGGAGWKGEIVGEFGKGGARVGMVDVSYLNCELAIIVLKRR